VSSPPRRPRSEGAWVDLAREAARGHGEAAGPVHAQRLLVFTLDGAPYALPVERVREIVRRRPITPVPRLPPEVLGVISLRGRVIQVIDLRRRLALPAGAVGRRSRIVVAHDGEGRVAGFLVDGVLAVVTAADEALHDPPPGSGGAVEGLCRVGERFVSVVDLDRAMDVDAGA
jgi:purine-binding chemotaxis protein CheW